MATAISCDLCQQEPAEMMQTVLRNGDTISVGNACMVMFFAGALTGLLSDMAPPEVETIAPQLAGLAAIIGPSQAGLADAREAEAAFGPGTVAPAKWAGAYAADVEAARRLLADPSTYEDGNTEYGLEQALELARLLVAEADAAERTADAIASALQNADDERSEAEA